MTLIRRQDKGSALTHAELDGNFDHFTDQTVWNHGIEDWSNDGPSQSLGAGVDTVLANNGATSTLLNIPGNGPMWNSGTDAFDFTDTAVGDFVHIRIDLDIITNTNSDEFDLYLNVGIGALVAATPLFQTPCLPRTYVHKAGTQHLVADVEIYIGSNLVSDYPAQVVLRADGAGDSVLVHGWYIRHNPQHPIITHS